MLYRNGGPSSDRSGCVARILGLGLAGVITYTGWMCIGVPRFGPQLTGSFLLIVGLFLFTLQLYLWWEQIVNDTDPFADIDDEDIDEDRL